jgi:hypothetical protein
VGKRISGNKFERIGESVTQYGVLGPWGLAHVLAVRPRHTPFFVSSHAVFLFLSFFRFDVLV